MGLRKERRKGSRKMAWGDFDGLGCIRLCTVRSCGVRWMYCSSWFITEICKDMSAGLQQAACLTRGRQNTREEGTPYWRVVCHISDRKNPVCTWILCSYSLWLLKVLHPEMESRYTICCVCKNGLPFAAGRNNVKVNLMCGWPCIVIQCG